jgi:hypothetical protein
VLLDQSRSTTLDKERLNMAQAGLMERAVDALERIATSAGLIVELLRKAPVMGLPPTAGAVTSVAEAKKAEVAKVPVTEFSVPCGFGCGEMVTKENGSRKQDGSIVHVGCKKAPEPRDLVEKAASNGVKMDQSAAEKVPEKPAETPAAQPPSAAESKPKKLTADDVRAALKDFAKREGSEAALELLKANGASTVSALAEDKFADVIAKASGKAA